MNKYSEERKRLQLDGLLPEWYSTAGLQMFKEKYQWADTPKDQYAAIARAAANHVRHVYPNAEEKFFNLLWNGWLSPSTPTLANMGRGIGLPVSCSGNYIHDSISGFYKARSENAMLTKYGFGTSSYLNDIRPRGAAYKGGRASGVIPVLKGFVQDMEDVAQSSARRGAWAGYIDISHNDFDEIINLLSVAPDGLNIGWIIHDDFLTRLKDNDPEAQRRWTTVIETKMVTGKGYLLFVDKINRHRPIDYIYNNLYVKASNLCTEINLVSDEEHTFTCIISSMNYAKYNEWEKTDSIFWAILFLDCVAQEFIDLAEGIEELSKAVRFTKKSRALGLGACGLHTLFMKEGFSFDSLEAQFLHHAMFDNLKTKTKEASLELGRILGIPEWCKKSKQRNTHLIAIAPTKSTALIMGGVSEGINPVPALVYTQTTSAGEMQRIDPTFLAFLKEKGYNTPQHLKEIEDAFGSCQSVSWMTAEEKKLFRIAFEYDMSVILRLASQRQKFIDQGQSLNLFIAGDADEEYIARIHQQAAEDEWIHQIYYIYSSANVAGSKGECEVCS